MHMQEVLRQKLKELPFAIRQAVILKYRVPLTGSIKLIAKMHPEFEESKVVLYNLWGGKILENALDEVDSVLETVALIKKEIISHDVRTKMYREIAKSIY